MLMFLIPGVILYRSPHLLQSLTSAGTEPSVSAPDARHPPQSQIMPQASQSARVATIRGREPVVPRRPAPEEPVDPPDMGESDRAEPLVKPRTLADLLPTQQSPSAEDLIRLQLELDSQKWIAPLELSDGAIQLAVMDVSPCPTSTSIEPDSGELSFDRPTRVTFDDMSGLAIDLRLAHVGSESKLAVVGDWVARFKGDNETPFSLSRLKNLQKSFAKQTSVATNQMSILLAEKQQKQTFLHSKGVKRLESVNAATNRIKWIDSQLPALQVQSQYEQSMIQQFLAFANNVQQLHDDGELVIRRIGDEHPDP